MHDTMSSGELELNAPNLDPKGLAKVFTVLGLFSIFIKFVTGRESNGKTFQFLANKRRIPAV